MKITWSEAKNIELKNIRNLNFEMVLVAIDDGKILADEQHSNLENYAHQRILVVDIDAYAVVVPYVINGDEIFLKTMFRDRKMQRRYYAK
ncbi:hypothetical protein SPBRAN_1941 [uncultured Candidatus Thioglobus sp.]|nr:hypothetical protein SPBRAN_1941 [uncultured Candidatus Thioglobus sp.]